MGWVDGVVVVEMRWDGMRVLGKVMSCNMKDVSGEWRDCDEWEDCDE